MPAVFDRDSLAASYARRHKAVDTGISEVYYLPTGAPPKEIRLVEVNRAILSTAGPEPIDFGVDAGSPGAHKLVVLDVTPKQWANILEGKLPLPSGWNLDGSRKLGGRPRHRQ